VSYVYLQTDDVSNIIIKDENSAGEPNDANWNYELAFYYLRSKQLDFVLWGRWKLDAEDEVVYQADRAMQFRFDSARGRWLAAGLDPPTTLATESYPNSGWALAGDMLFTDYLGDLPYNDGVLDQSTYAHSDATRYLGLAAERDISSGAETYYHGDLIDSTVLTTDAAADSDVRVAYTAFGEILTTGDPGEGGAPGGAAPEGAPRYQYAGGYGYESGLLALQGADTTLPPITLQHVGHRWYQPDSGRFVQRDPIGIAGGLNVYAYAMMNPVHLTDPLGLSVPHWSDGLPTSGAIIDLMGGAALGGVGGALGAGAGLTGVGVGAAGGAMVWFGGKAVLIQAGDLVCTLWDLFRSNQRNDIQRYKNRNVNPPVLPNIEPFITPGGDMLW